MASLSLANAKVCIVGATSTVARGIADQLASRGSTLYLAARSEDDAERIARDLKVRYRTEVDWGRFEATSPRHRERLFDTAIEAMGGLDIVLIAVGMLGDQTRAEQDPDHLREIIEINYTTVAQLLIRAAQYLEAQESGMLVALSSVAGDRGRPSNYAYGSAKAGLTTFLGGLRGRLHESGVHVLTAKLGPTDTKMTFDMEDPPPLMADPTEVAHDIVRAMEQQKEVCYSPQIWRYIMGALRLIPSSLFKKLSL